MKQVRWMVGFVWGAALASSWWAAAVFGHGEKTKDFNPADIWALPAVLTVLTVIAAVAYLATHADDD